jgi:isopentenyl diphosphate isomerase/L-lactate dehydrogenase-like FMN-dependent dehydrogenase
MLALDYSDVSLISRHVSSISSRNDIDTSVEFCGRKLSIPIISSPMLDVSDGYVCQIMMDNGALGIIHRFSNIADQVAEYRKSHGAGAALGIGEDFHDRFTALHDAGCRIFCIDVANSANLNIEDPVKKIQFYDPNSHVIVGNVMSKEGFLHSVNFLNVKAVRVGVAGGSGCTTKNATGLYYPAVSLLQEVYKARKKWKEFFRDASIIADGGIREPADFCKSIAFGADMTMLGRLIANTKESPATKVKINNKWYTEYHGSASYEVQQKYRNIPRYIEGRKILLEFEGKTVKEVLTTFMDGLKSSMSYVNASNLSEYRENIDYVEVRQ